MKNIAPVFIMAHFILFAVSAGAADKVVVIPMGGSNTAAKLWGKGRPETRLLAHTDQNGYCTSGSGIKFALSFHMATWGNSTEVCPSGTWVCRNDELPDSASCPLVPITSYRFVNCDGSYYPDPASELTLLDGWVADADPANDHFGRKRYTHDLTKDSAAVTCRSYRVWCCWR